MRLEILQSRTEAALRKKAQTAEAIRELEATLPRVTDFERFAAEHARLSDRLVDDIDAYMSARAEMERHIDHSLHPSHRSKVGS